MTILKGGGRHGDDGFEALYRKFFGRVYKYFRRFGITDSEAQDLAQETFVRIYRTFDTFRGDGEWSFIATTAKRVMLNWRRGLSTSKRGVDLRDLDDPDLGFEPPDDNAPDLVDELDQKNRMRRVAVAVSELSDPDREVLRHKMLGYKYTEIAAMLNMSVDAVKSRLRDTLRRLRAKLGVKS